MSYKLHYPMLLPIDGMIDENGVDLTHEKAAAALRAMADRLEANPNSTEQIFGRTPVASEREDRWVLRATTMPNFIRKADGGWVEVDSRNIDMADTRTSEEAAAMSPGASENSVWVRPEDISFVPVLATLRSEEGTFLGQVDLREWMAWSWRSGSDLEAAISSGWDFTAPMQAADDDDDDPLHDDPNIMAAAWKYVPFTLRIEESGIPHAIAYLDDLCPGLIDQIGARGSDESPTP